MNLWLFFRYEIPRLRNFSNLFTNTFCEPDYYHEDSFQLNHRMLKFSIFFMQNELISNKLNYKFYSNLKQLMAMHAYFLYFFRWREISLKVPFVHLHCNKIPIRNRPYVPVSCRTDSSTHSIYCTWSHVRRSCVLCAKIGILARIQNKHMWWFFSSRSTRNRF